MVLTSCPKCHHRFPLQAPAPLCRCAPPAMLSLSITAASASSLNGGHVVVNTAAPSPGSGSGISVCATIRAPSLPWGSMPPLAEPVPAMTWPPPWATSATPTTLSLSIRPEFARPPPTPKGVQYRLTGGGILEDRGGSGGGEAVLLQPRPGSRGKPGVLPCGCGPEQSPSAPLSFVLPSQPSLLPPLHARPPAPQEQSGTSELDLKLLQATTRALQSSGWYYEGLSWQESAATLKDAAPGTFLVRDSSDYRFLFSLSVQTDRGPTSVRLHYISGGFRLDAEPHLAPTMPLFPCVLQLIEHYVACSRRSKRPPPASRTCGREQVWVDARGQMYSHILLTEPRRHTVPGLQHLARLAVHRQIRAAASGMGSILERDLKNLSLPSSIREYLQDYPFTL